MWPGKYFNRFHHRYVLYSSGLYTLTHLQYFRHLVHPRLINYKDTKIKCRLLKKLTCKGTCKGYWRYSSWYYRPTFVKYCPSNLLQVTSPPSSQSQSTVYVQTVCGWEGVGVLSCVGDHILQEFNTLFLTGFRIYKIALPPQTKH